MDSMLVSVICLCYNHEKFLKESILSVINQTYCNIEIIVVDDYSSDISKELIKQISIEFPQLITIFNEKNVGNCKSFNKALAVAKGKYVIDFATDDVMFPERIEEQIHYFESLGNEYGVVYSNSEFIDENGRSLDIYASNSLPVGDVFSHVLSKHVYEPSSMMVNTNFFKSLNGYNESLAYEDFDFVLRSSRKKKVGYIDKVLTKRRKLNNSHSSKFRSSQSHEMHKTTFLVCEESYNWCETVTEFKAWDKRLIYETRAALKRRDFEILKMYVELLNEKSRLFIYRNFLRVLMIF